MANFTQRVAPHSHAPTGVLRDADVIITHVEVSDRHGVGKLVQMMYLDEPNILSIRSANYYNGQHELGELAFCISHENKTRDAVFARVLEAMGDSTARRVVCIPYLPDDVRTAIAVKEIYGAPLCTYIMDDQNICTADGIPDNLMDELLAKSGLRLAISPEMAVAYEKKYGYRMWYMPPLVPGRLIPSRLIQPLPADPREGVIIGNIWGAKWVNLLRDTVRGSGVKLRWYCNGEFRWLPCSKESLIEDSIIPCNPLKDDPLVAMLRAARFAVLPSGTLDKDDDRRFLAQLSLPSRLPYMMATSHIPVLVLGNRQTAAARFVERFGIGLVVDYDQRAFLDAVNYISRPEVNLAMRKEALVASGRFSDCGAAEWIWQSLAQSEAVDRRYEDLISEEKPDLSQLVQLRRVASGDALDSAPGPVTAHAAPEMAGLSEDGVSASNGTALLTEPAGVVATHHEVKARHGNLSRWMWVVYLLPAFLTAAFIAAYGVNVPYLDEWGLPYMYSMLKSGGHGFNQLFWAPTNEHRIVVPKLVWAALAFPTHWNLVLNMFLTFGVMLGTFMGMARFAIREHAGNRMALHASVIASGMLLFSFVHWDVWLFSFCLTFVLALCCGIAAILVLVSSELRPQIRLWLAVGLCFLATCSSAQGILAWLVILPAVYLAFPTRQQSVRACLSILVCFGLTMAIYFIDYHPNDTFRSDLLLIFKKPAQVLSFGLAFVGAPVSQAFFATSVTTLIAECLGVASLAVFAVTVFAAIRAGLLRRTLGWILIGVYGMGADVMVTAARSEWGAGFIATASRYMINTVPIWVATLLLLAELASRIRAWRSVLWATVVVVVVGELASYPGGLEKGRQVRDRRTIAAQSLEIMPYIDPTTDQSEQSLLFPLFNVITKESFVRMPAELLNQVGLRRIEHNAVFDEHPPFCGCLDTPVLKDGKPFPIGKFQPLGVSGWALYPGKKVLPKVVFFSADDRRVFMFGALVGHSFSRPDVAGFMKNPALIRSGWSTEIPAAFLPTGEFELKAWVYDREHSRFLRLNDCTGPKRISRSL